MSDWLPSLNALRAFEAVARHLSYRDAAAELHVTPAAVKQLVQKLEAALGQPLVRRQGRGLALTEAGVAGRPDLAEGFRALGQSVERMRRAEARPSLTLSVEPTFATAWLIPRLEGFKARHPDIDALIDSSLRIVDLARERVDAAIRYGVAPAPGLVAHRLFDDETLAVCSPALAKGPPEIRRPHDLARATLLHMDVSHMPWITVSHHWFDWATWLAEVGAGEVAPGRGLRFNDYNLAIQAAIAGQGVALGSWPMVKDAIAQGHLVARGRGRRLRPLAPGRGRRRAQLNYRAMKSTSEN